MIVFHCSWQIVWIFFSLSLFFNSKKFWQSNPPSAYLMFSISVCISLYIDCEYLSDSYFLILSDKIILASPSLHLTSIHFAYNCLCYFSLLFSLFTFLKYICITHFNPFRKFWSVCWYYPHYQRSLSAFMFLFCVSWTLFGNL